MFLHLFTALPSNIFDKLNYLKRDYTGLNFNFIFLTNFVLGFLISLSILFISLLIGQKIRTLLFKKFDIPEINYLIDIALGSILIGTGVTILGFFSLLKSPIILSYVILLLTISFYKINLNYVKCVKKSICLNIKLLQKNKFVYITLVLFIILAIVNLINPEIREDQYHVDLPKLYFSQQTIMISSKEPLHVSASPLLPEMSYLIGIFLWSEESARYLHFMFYLLVLLTLFEFSKIKGYEFSIYTPLLFATAPVVIHETSSMYVDFQWIFYFLLAILVILKNKNISYPAVFLSGVFLGGMVSSKLWTIVLIPLMAIYLMVLLKTRNLNKLFKYLFVLSAGIVLISFIWFLRAFILTGNPFYPAFANQQHLLGHTSFQVPITRLITLNTFLINPLNSINIFSPLFFLGIALFIYGFKDNIKMLSSRNLFILFGMTLLLYLSINYPYGRYLLGLYVLFIFFSAVGIEKTIEKFKVIKLLFITAIGIIFIYYFVSSAFVLPYTFGFANKNSYLTGILSKDNSSYYNFDNKFDKYISNKDYVATYGIFGYYYANFKYIDVDYVFNSNGESFDLLKQKGITKLFIKGGDINYFCKTLSLKNCTPDKYTHLSSFMGSQPYYLYGIK